MAACDPIRLGLVGAGEWGKKYIQTILSIESVVLGAVASRTQGTRELIPASCRLFYDWKDLIVSDEVDGIILATPPSEHSTGLITALRHDKPVLVEKPMVLNTDELAEVETEAVGKIVRVNHTQLHQPAFQALVSEAAVRGAIRGIRASAGSYGPYRTDVNVLWDWGAHDLAMCMVIEPGPWTAAGVTILEQLSFGQRLAVDLLSPSSYQAKLIFSNLDRKHRWFAVDFEDETLIFQDYIPDKLISCRGTGAQPGDSGTNLAVSSELPLTRAVKQFADAIRRRDTSSFELSIGTNVVRLLSSLNNFKT